MYRRVMIPHGPGDDAALEEMRRVWSEVCAYFAGPRSGLPVVDEKGHGYLLNIDAQHAAALIDFGGPHLPPLAPVLSGTYIDVEVQPATGSATPPPRLWRGVLEQLFLAVNLCVPGTLDLTDSWYFLSFHPSGAVSRGIDHPPQLGCESIYAAYRAAVELRGWPSFDHIPFETVWEWLHDESVYAATIGATPVQRAAFALLRVCGRDRYDPENYFTCIVAIEGLLRHGSILQRREVKRAIEHELGAPSTLPEETDEPNWFDLYYEGRNPIAHGDFAVIRPDLRDEQLDGEAAILARKLQEPVELSLVILMALLRRRATMSQHR